MYTFNMVKDFFVQAENNSDDVSAMDKLMDALRTYRLELIHNKSAYYIAISAVGIEDDFTYIYTPVGFVTQDVAMGYAIGRTCDNLADMGYYGIREVTKEEFDKFRKLAYISEALNNLSVITVVDMIDYPPCKSVINELGCMIKSLRDELKLDRHEEVCPCDDSILNECRNQRRTQ